MSAALSILVVDDERPAREDLARLLRSAADVQEVVCVASGGEALRLLSERSFHGLFLDVRMPDLDGLEVAGVLRRFAQRPAVVFVSAYEDAAVDAFGVRALDYLMKPVSRQRVERALARVVETAQASAAPDARAPTPEPLSPGAAAEEELAGDIVAVDNVLGGGTRLVHRSEILYLQAYGDYIRIVCDHGRFLRRGRLSDIEQRWHQHGFVRVHRGFVANLHRAVEVRPALNGTASIVFADGLEVPVARRQVGELRRTLGV